MDNFQHVLVGVHLNKASDRTVLAKACQLTDSDDIEVVHVCNNLHDGFEDYGVGEFTSTKELNERIVANADARLAAVCKDFGITHHHILAGDIAGAIHRYTADHTDLVIVGSHGRHSLRTFFGSTSNAMLHGTPCDVLAVHISDDAITQAETYQHLLVAVDLSEESNQVIDHALNIACKHNAEVSLCHTYISYGGYRRAQERYALEAMALKYNIHVDDVYSLNGTTAGGVHTLALELDADLLVVGTHGKQGIELLTGSTSNAVLHGAHCDALSVRVGAWH